MERTYIFFHKVAFMGLIWYILYSGAVAAPEKPGGGQGRINDAAGVNRKKAERMACRG